MLEQRARRPRRRRPARTITSLRHAGVVQQPRDVQSRSASRTRTACRAPRCRSSSAGTNDVAADEVRVVPGRDVGHHAERLVADALAHAACRRTPLRRRWRASVCATKKSMRGSRPLSSLRDWLIGLPTSRGQRGGQRVELGHQRGAKALRSRPGARAAARRPARAAPRVRRAPCWRPSRRRRLRRSAISGPGGRVVDLSVWASVCCRRSTPRRGTLRVARAAFRKSRSNGASSKLRPGRRGYGTPGAIAHAAT